MAIYYNHQVEGALIQVWTETILRKGGGDKKQNTDDLYKKTARKNTDSDNIDHFKPRYLALEKRINQSLARVTCTEAHRVFCMSQFLWAGKLLVTYFIQLI